MKNVVWLLMFQIILLVVGQIFWKMGVSRIGIIKFNNMMELLVSPYVWSGIVIYGLATIFWMAILSRASLSTVYPMQSLAYVFGIMAGVLLFEEKVTAVGWAGVFLIILGVFLTSSGLK
jgi:drug/metabolite transporter (DMT)-like permease